MSCSINIKNLTIKRGDKILHENINISLSHKEKIAILGDNGVGKTTLLEYIAGLHFPFSGSLKIFHEEVKNADEYKKFRHLVGFLAQNSDDQFLLPFVEDDIAFSLLANGTNADEAYKKTKNIMKKFNISHLEKKVVYHLSGGEKKLVALAGALVHEPKIMLLDEPTNDLDLNFENILKSILKELDKSAIIVSHDLNFVKNVADRIYRLDSSGLREIT